MQHCLKYGPKQVHKERSGIGLGNNEFELFVSLLCWYCKDMVAKILLLKQLEVCVGRHKLGHSPGLVCVSCIHTSQPQPVCLCVQCTFYQILMKRQCKYNGGAIVVLNFKFKCNPLVSEAGLAAGDWDLRCLMEQLVWERPVKIIKIGPNLQL